MGVLKGSVVVVELIVVFIAACDEVERMLDKTIPSVNYTLDTAQSGISVAPMDPVSTNQGFMLPKAKRVTLTQQPHESSFCSFFRSSGTDLSGGPFQIQSSFSLDCPLWSKARQF
jgi:hypothetical protein